MTSIFFFPSMYNKTIIRFGFCDIQNNQGLGKGYQSRNELKDVGILEANWQPLTWLAYDRPADPACCESYLNDNKHNCPHLAFNICSDICPSTLRSLRYEDVTGRPGRQRQWTRETFAGPVLSPKTKCLRRAFSQRTATSIIRTSYKLFTEAMTSIRL